MTRSASWLAVLVAALALNGCSDDGEPAPAPPSTATASPQPSATATVAPTATRTMLPSPSPSATLTPLPTATGTEPPATVPPTPTATVIEGTPEPTPAGCCGDGTVDPGEGCDDGNQIGGDGCAPNCTVESVVALPVHGSTTIQAASFALPIEITSMQAVRLGAPTSDGGLVPCEPGVAFAVGEIPFTQRATDLSFDPASVPGLVCVCVRAQEIRRCGPALVNRRGTDCSVGDDCGSDPSICGDEAECRSAHGEGNASSGVIGCAGLDDVDYDFHIDGGTGAAVCTRSGGRAPAGSAFLYATTRIGTIMDSGTCSEDSGNEAKGPDGIPCTDDDPATSRGAAATTVPLTTGSVAGAILYAGTKPPIEEGANCGALACQTSAEGAPFSCDDLPGAPRLCSGFGSLAQPMVGDIVVTTCYEL